MKQIITLCVLLLVLISGCARQKTIITKESTLEPRYQKLAAFYVIGLEEEDAMEGGKMMELWGAYFENKDNIPNPISDTAYGITYFGKNYNPQTMKGYKYFVGRQVKDLDNVPQNLLGHEVPAANYAVFEHKGKIETIGNTYAYIFGEWLKQSGKKPAMQDVFELYDERFIHDSDNSVLEIWVPIAE